MEYVFIEKYKTDYKIITQISLEFGSIEFSKIFFSVNLLKPYFLRLVKKINKLSDEFIGFYNLKDLYEIKNLLETLYSLSDFQKTNVNYLKLMELINQNNELINQLCYLEIKKTIPKMVNDYKYPITTKNSVKPFKK